MSLNPMARTASYAALALVITDHPVVTRPVTVASGNNLKRGALVGKITASKKVVLSLSAASDGSEKPYGVLMEDVVQHFIDMFFPGQVIQECVPFRITRNADMGVREDQAADLLVGMEEVLDWI